MERYVSDYMTAVVLANTAGSHMGWSTLNPPIADKLLFDQHIVEQVMTINKLDSDGYTDMADDLCYELEQYCYDNFENELIDCIFEIYPDSLRVEWVPQGLEFCVLVSNNRENLVLQSDVQWFVG